MKKILFIALAFSTFSCSSDNNLEDTIYNVMESGASMAIDSLHHAADKELKRHTGVDSLSSKINSLDSLNVEREVKRQIIKQLSE